MGTTSIVTNNGNATLSVTATKLVFTTQPAGSTSGSARITSYNVCYTKLLRKKNKL